MGVGTVVLENAPELGTACAVLTAGVAWIGSRYAVVTAVAAAGFLLLPAGYYLYGQWAAFRERRNRFRELDADTDRLSRR
jgi:hypothetical protein